MADRRFNEAEVAEIFRRASEAQPSSERGQMASGDGMTLAQLQEIGREVGIPAESISRAAQVLDRTGQPVSRTLLGVPIGVGRTVELDRRLTEDEWERLVVDLRETFDARGTVRSEGSLRQWTNGNLQVLLEPTATGHRIRFRTVKGEARGMLMGGLSVAGIGALGLVAAVAQGLTDAGLVSTMGVLVAMGAAMFGSGAVRLPSWARIRRRQMEEVAERIALIAKAPATEE